MSKTHTTVLITLLLSTASASPSLAAVKLDPIFTSGIVLQQALPVAIYGTASPGEPVTVSFDTQSKQTAAEPDGTWTLYLDPMTAGGPFTLTAAGSTTASVPDVSVGEVWLCAGQSNMLRGKIYPSEMEVHPEVRWRRFGSFVSGPGQICWDFAVDLQAHFGVPVMIANNARGGSKIRQWLPPTVIPNADPKVDEIVATFSEWGKWYADLDSVAPYTIRGVIWWQGESDMREPDAHHHLLPALIQSWRDQWSRTELPFVIVQVPTGKGLAPYKQVRNLPLNPNRGHISATMRQAFFRTQRGLPNVSMVINGDLRGGIHPPKSERPQYSARILEAVRANVYGEDVVWSGPLFGTMSAEGNSLRLRFRSDTAQGLKALGGPLQGFSVSADGLRWFWADSVEIQGEEVLVSSTQVGAPQHVRYAWGKRTRFANLYNGADRLAAPFEATLGQ